MTTKIQKIGNSLGIHLPRELTKALSLEKGSRVSINKKGNSLVIKKENKKPTLKELCGQITPENRHEEIYWGNPVGKELV